MRELGGAVAVYRSGRLVSSTRPDLAVLGTVPWLPPPEAYVRSVRGWQEPVVLAGDETSVFAPMRAEEPIVVGVVGLRLQALGRSPSPGEWFLVTGILAMVLALTTAERLGERLGRPLRRLVGAAHRLERGEPFAELETGGDEDVRALGHAFETMAHEVQRREEELRRERDLLERVLGTLSAAVVVADAGGRVELANPAARQLLASEELLDDLSRRFGAVIGSLISARHGGRASGGDRCGRQASPEALWRVTALPLPRSAGRVLLVMEDLSELARAERLVVVRRAGPHRRSRGQEPSDPDPAVGGGAAGSACARARPGCGRGARWPPSRSSSASSTCARWRRGSPTWSPSSTGSPRPSRSCSCAGEVAAEYEVLRQRGVAVRVIGEERGDRCRRAVDPAGPPPPAREQRACPRRAARGRSSWRCGVWSARWCFRCATPAAGSPASCWGACSSPTSRPPARGAGWGSRSCSAWPPWPAAPSRHATWTAAWRCACCSRRGHEAGTMTGMVRRSLARCGLALLFAGGVGAEVGRSLKHRVWLLGGLPDEATLTALRAAGVDGLVLPVGQVELADDASRFTLSPLPDLKGLAGWDVTALVWVEGSGKASGEPGTFAAQLAPGAEVPPGRGRTAARLEAVLRPGSWSSPRAPPESCGKTVELALPAPELARHAPRGGWEGVRAVAVAFGNPPALSFPPSTLQDDLMALDAAGRGPRVLPCGHRGCPACDAAAGPAGASLAAIAGGETSVYHPGERGDVFQSCASP